MPCDVLHRQLGAGHTPSSAVDANLQFGPNLIDVQVPSVGRLLVEEVRGLSDSVEHGLI
jgi:hypothetical protein